MGWGRRRVGEERGGEGKEKRGKLGTPPLGLVGYLLLVHETAFEPLPPSNPPAREEWLISIVLRCRFWL